MSDEAAQLRKDIASLRLLLDDAIDRNASLAITEALAHVLGNRRDRLENLEIRDGGQAPG